MTLHLRGLNGIRAIAAFAVLVDHINGSFEGFALKVVPKTDLAGYGVTIFFSLSGFLITYLLLKEKDTSVISISNFYLRRILRIWPVYFLIILLVIAISGEAIDYNLLYYILFLPNVPFVFGGTIELIGHYWSLGVEEQFYLFWPWCMKYIKNTFYFLIVFIMAMVLLKLVFNIYFGGWSSEYAFVYQLRYDCMAIGAIGAVVSIYRKELIEHKLFNYLVILSWAVLVLVSLNKFHLFSIIDHEIIAVVTATIILNQAFGKKVIFKLENRILNHIGKISYGVYMYHPVIIFLLGLLLKDLDVDPFIKYPLVYVLTFALTLLVSNMSYYWVEKPFLSLKARFTQISIP